MEVLYLLLPLSLVLVCAVVWALLWAIRSGQFDDLEGPAFRVLMDDDAPAKPAESGHQLDPGQRSSGAGDGSMELDLPAEVVAPGPRSSTTQTQTRGT